MKNPLELIVDSEKQIGQVTRTLEELIGLQLEGESAKKLLELASAHEHARTELTRHKLILFQLLVTAASTLPASEREYKPHAGICDYHIVDKNTIRVTSRGKKQGSDKPAGTYNLPTFISTQDIYVDDLIEQIMARLHHYLTHSGNIHRIVKAKLSDQAGRLEDLLRLCQQTP